jgi:hypothetical protein
MPLHAWESARPAAPSLPLDAERRPIRIARMREQARAAVARLNAIR